MKPLEYHLIHVFHVCSQMAPPGVPQQQSQQQPPQAAPGSAEAQLISFD